MLRLIYVKNEHLNFNIIRCCAFFMVYAIKSATHMRRENGGVA